MTESYAELHTICYDITEREECEEQNGKEEAGETQWEGEYDREGALEGDGKQCVEVQRSAERGIERLYGDQRWEMKRLKVKRLGSEL